MENDKGIGEVRRISASELPPVRPDRLEALRKVEMSGHLERADVIFIGNKETMLRYLAFGREFITERTQVKAPPEFVHYNWGVAADTQELEAALEAIVRIKGAHEYDLVDGEMWGTSDGPQSVEMFKGDHPRFLKKRPDYVPGIVSTATAFRKAPIPGRENLLKGLQSPRFHESVRSFGVLSVADIVGDDGISLFGADRLWHPGLPIYFASDEFEAVLAAVVAAVGCHNFTSFESNIASAWEDVLNCVP